jgi:hypothetical protein
MTRLAATATPLWGRMTAPQMVAHLTDASRMAIGEITIQQRNLPLARTRVFRWVFLHVMPFPRNAPSAREIVSRTPTDFDAEKQQFLALLHHLGSGTPEIQWAVHPIFGALSGDEWCQLAHKHIDHHLRQFGV